MSFINIPVQCGGPCEESSSSISASASISASPSISVSPSISISPSISASPSISPSLSPSGSDVCIYYPLLNFDLVGYGTDSRFAYQLYESTGNPGDLPTILYVDSTATDVSFTDATHGSFRWAINQAYPRIILFETSGTIDFTGIVYEVDMDEPYCWIAGGSAPSPGIDIFGVQFRITSHDILITDITFSKGDTNFNSYSIDRDALNMYGSDVYNICIDHCTVRWGTDEILSVGRENYDNAEDVTISNNLIYEPLRAFGWVDEKNDDTHAYASLVNCNGFTWYRNATYGCQDRTPFIQARGATFGVSGNNAKTVIINNFNINTYIRLGGMFDSYCDVAYVGNVAYRMNDDYTHGIQDYVATLAGSYNTASKFYCLDPACKYMDDHPLLDPTDPTDSFEAIYELIGEVGEVVSPVDISAYDILNATNGDVKDYIIANCGPKYLDAHDLRILNYLDTNPARDPLDEVAPIGGSLDWVDFGLTPNINARPARAVRWDTSNGNVSAGYDWNADPQSFDINISTNGGVAWSGPDTINLTADCNNYTDVINHIDAQFVAAGIDHLVEAARIYKPYDVVNEYVEIRTKGSGSDYIIKIDNSDATGIDLATASEITFEGRDALSGGYLTRAENAATWTVPNYPHEPYNAYLTRIEAWVLLNMPDDLCSDYSESASLSDGFCSEAQAVIDNMDDTPDGTRQAQINGIVCGLVDAGYWSRIERLFVPAAHSNTGNTETLDWKDPSNAARDFSYGAGTITFTANSGVAGSGGANDYCDTNFDPAADGVVIGQDDVTYGMWITTDVSETSYDWGSSSTAQAAAQLRQGGATDRTYWLVNDTTGVTSGNGTVTDSRHMYLFTRRGATDSEAYLDGVSYDTDATASTGEPTENIYFCGCEHEMDNAGTKRFAMFMIMDAVSDSEASDIYDIFNAYKWW